MTDPRDHRPWRMLRWPLVVVVLAVVGWLVVDRVMDTLDRGGERLVEGGETVVDGLGGIAERFHSGHITTTFVAAIPRLAHGDSLSLEVAVFEASETFTRSSERRALFDLLPLGTTVTEIRVPVTYRYHLRLDDPWQLRVRDRACLVVAPPIRPTLPPAIHTDRLEKRIDSGWLRFDDDTQMAELEASITPAVSARAGNPAHLDLVREICRRRVAEFVRAWLLAEDHWREDRFTAVEVRFADEPDDELPAAAPTLRLSRDDG